MTKTIRVLSIAAGCAALFGLPGAAAAADVSQQPLQFTVNVSGTLQRTLSGSPTDHLVSFSTPVEIPGVGLKAGTYLFRFITPSVVQVTSPDRSKVYGMFMTETAAREDTGRQAEMTFARDRSDAPVRIDGWFFSSALDGVAPVYPRG